MISRAKKNVPVASKKTTSKRGKGKSKKDVVVITETVAVMQDPPRRSNRSSITISYAESPEEEKISRSGKKHPSNKTDQGVSNPKRRREPLTSVKNKRVPIDDVSSSSNDDFIVSSPEYEFEE